jgi:hypothetical protein
MKIIKDHYETRIYMKKKTTKLKEEPSDLDKFTDDLTKSMVKNLDYNLQHPEEYEKHEEQVEQELDNVLKGKERKSKKK